MSETKHTAEGLRAAEAVWRRLKSAMDSFPDNNVHTVEMAVIIDREAKLPELLADSKKLNEPATCNAGHKSNLPLALWDCPVCTQLLRDKLQQVGDFLKLIFYNAGQAKGDGSAAKPGLANLQPMDWDLIVAKARALESALGGKAE